LPQSGRSRSEVPARSAINIKRVINLNDALMQYRRLSRGFMPEAIESARSATKETDELQD